MLSCDTFAVCAARSETKGNLLCKNSDRPLGEAQPLFFSRARDHKKREMLRTTNLLIPEHEHTFSVLGAKPYWIWGFEIGCNECGVVIGNEAQGSRNAETDAEGILGMDLLRLGLERGETAEAEMNVITALLEQYGQNANANALFDRRYENSFLIMDAKEIWLLETAGREWAAKRVTDFLGISNCYAIETDYDRLSENCEALARERGWARPDGKFNFAESYTLAAPRQTNALPRFRRLNALLSASDTIGFDECKRILRDHFEGEWNEPRFGASTATFSTVCMHAAAWDSAQTASSWLVSRDEALGLILRVAFSTPCRSAYLPVYMTGRLPKLLTKGKQFYDEESLWWRLERLGLLVSVDEARYAGDIERAMALFEARCGDDIARREDEARSRIRSGDAESASAILTELMNDTADLLYAVACFETDRLVGRIAAAGGIVGPRADFIRAYAERTHMPLL